MGRTSPSRQDKVWVPSRAPGLLGPRTHALTPVHAGEPQRRFLCEGREPGKNAVRQTETGEGALAAAMEARREAGCAGAGGTCRVRGPAASTHILRDGLPPRVCNSSRNEIRCKGDRKNRRQAKQKAGRQMVMAPISFFSCINGHNPPRPLPRYSSCLQEGAQGFWPPTHTTAHHRRCSTGDRL